MIVIGTAAASSALLYGWQVRSPKRVSWVRREIGGRPLQCAEGLVVQHDNGESVWASRGYAIYCSRNGSAFERVHVMRMRPGVAWFGYLGFLRRWFGYQELVEVHPVDASTLVVIGGGFVYRVDVARRTQERTHRLRYFGVREGRGLMPHGLCSDSNGTLYFGEYVTAVRAKPVGIWKSEDEGRNWRISIEFPPGTTRHIHTVLSDPYDEGTIWIGTGDRNEHVFVGVSNDEAETFECVGRGAQSYRTCSFAFFEDNVLWAMDADFETNFVVSFARANGRISLGARLPDVTYYARRIDERRVALALSHSHAEIWVARANDGAAVPWLGWQAPTANRHRRPAPGVRFARGHGGTHLHASPLRTAEHEACVVRLPIDDAPEP